MKQVLERVQKRTVDVGEIVQNSLKQREDELARREAEITRQERDLFEEELLEVQLIEKRIKDEERKLQQKKDLLLKLKQHQNEEINSLREQRQSVINTFALEEQKQKAKDREAKENLMLSRKKLESENERRGATNRLIEVEINTKESEIDNARDIAQQEKNSLEVDIRESYIREIQSKSIDIENRKKAIVDSQNEMRRQQRLLEKKKELIATDHE